MPSTNNTSLFSIIKQYYLFFLLIVAISFTFYWLWEVWLPFFLALILAYLLNPAVNYFEKKGLGRTQSVSVVYLIISCILTISVIFLFPLLNYELKSAKHTIPLHIDQVKNSITSVEQKLQHTHPYFSKVNLTEHLITNMDKYFRKFVSEMPKVLEHLFEWIIIAVLIPLITFIFLQDGYQIKKRFIELIPNKYFEMVFGLLFRLEQQLGNYIKGKIWQTLILSILVSSGLLFIGIPYAIILGVFAGITHLVPYIGPMVGIIPIIIVAVFAKKGIIYLLFVALLFLIEQLVDHILLIPMIVGKSINMHPLLVIISLSVGGYAAGMWGMLLGVPVAGMLQVIVQEFTKEIKFRLYSDRIEPDRIEIYDPRGHIH